MKALTLKNLSAALALCAAAGSAGAAVLSFDSLTAFVYGDGAPLTGGMGYEGRNLTYREAGFQLTLNAPNAVPGAAHISDGTFEPETFNWHDGMENGEGTFVTLTRVGGGLFSVTGFDFLTDLSVLSADGRMVGTLEGAGTWGTALHGISELRLDSGAFNQLDNLALENANGSVPLPGTLPLLLGGLAAAAGRSTSRS